MAEDDRKENAEKNEDDKIIDETIHSVKDTAERTKRVVRDTAQQYLHTAGIDLDWEDIEDRIRERPYYSIGIAAGAGFLLGGGLGIALLGLFGRRAARDTASNLWSSGFSGSSLGGPEGLL